MTFPFEDLSALPGKRVRFHREGSGDTLRVNPDTRERIKAPYSVTVEGEVCGWQVGYDRVVDIAGYGYVDADKVTVIDGDTPRPPLRDRLIDTVVRHKLAMQGQLVLPDWIDDDGLIDDEKLPPHLRGQYTVMVDNSQDLVDRIITQTTSDPLPTQTPPQTPPDPDLA